MLVSLMFSFVLRALAQEVALQPKSVLCSFSSDEKTTWAILRRGFVVVSIKIPLSLPSPRASDPAGLEVARAYVVFSKPYKTPSESLQKCNANEVILFLSYFCLKKTIRTTESQPDEHNQAKP